MIEDRLVQALYVADGRGHGDMQDVVAEERARRKPRRPVARAVPSALATRTPREVPDVAKGARGDCAARLDVDGRNFGMIVSLSQRINRTTLN